MYLVIYFLIFLASAASAGSIQPKIIGGENVTIEEFPFQVSIKINGHHMCSGTIMTSTYILTAAQCIYSDDITLYEIVAGTSSILNPDSASMQTKQVKEIRKHPKYDKGTKANDAAWLVLSEELKFNDKVSFASLAVGTETSNFYILGWGSSSTSLYPIYPDMLQKAQVSLIDNYDCNILLNDYMGSSNLQATNVCTAPISSLNEGICIEDTGGPLLHVTAKKKTCIYGVMSTYFEPCGQRNVPSIYTYLNSVKDFIKDEDIVGIDTTC